MTLLAGMVKFARRLHPAAVKDERRIRDAAQVRQVARRYEACLDHKHIAPAGPSCRHR